MKQRTSPGRRSGRWAMLRPVTDADIDFLFYLFTVDENLVRYRLRGKPASPSTFQQFLWNGSDLQFLICSTKTGQPIGHISTYQTDDLSGTSKVAIALDPAKQRVAWPMEGVALFFNYCFETFPLRKLYFEVPEYNLHNFKGFAAAYLLKEGELVDATFADGGWWNQVILTLTRSNWIQFMNSRVGRAFSANWDANRPPNVIIPGL